MAPALHLSIFINTILTIVVPGVDRHQFELYFRYKRVLRACALQPDIDILPEKDLTEIGDKVEYFVILSLVVVILWMYMYPIFVLNILEPVRGLDS